MVGGHSERIGRIKTEQREKEREEKSEKQSATTTQ